MRRGPWMVPIPIRCYCRARGAPEACRLYGAFQTTGAACDATGLAGDSTMTDTLGDALPRQIAFVRDEVIPAYEEIGPAGAFALGWIRPALATAEKAWASGDVVAMVRAYAEIKDIKL